MIKKVGTLFLCITSLISYTMYDKLTIDTKHLSPSAPLPIPTSSRSNRKTPPTPRSPVEFVHLSSSPTQFPILSQAYFLAQHSRHSNELSPRITQ